LMSFKVRFFFPEKETKNQHNERLALQKFRPENNKGR